MNKRTKRPLRLRRSIRAGIRVAVFILTVSCTIEIAKLGWNTFQSRTGAPGGEVLILPLIVLLFYTGWTARKELTEFREDFRSNEGRVKYASSRVSTAATAYKR
jgi:hypothetical protein